MTITLAPGDHNSASETDFTGTVNLRHMRVDEALSGLADHELGRAFRGSPWEAQRLGKLLSGHIPVSEAFSTSDFKYAAFKELDTEMLRQYAELPAAWTQYVDQTLVSDFRPKRLRSRSTTQMGLARVPEATEYPDGHDYSQTGYAITVAKYGRRRALTWEAWMSGDAIDELEDIPTSQARQARETESIIAASTLLKVTETKEGFAAANVNTDFFKAGNGNAPTSVPLTADNLKTVLDGMAAKKNEQGRVIPRPNVTVVIGKALEATMQAILRVQEVRRTVGDVTTIEANPLANVTYVVEPMLDWLNSHAKAATTWFVVPTPGSPRPALWVAKLRGHEQPDLRVKADQGVTVGGGALSFDEGSFEIDTIEWRVRHVLGAQNGDALFTYASYGS